MNDSPKTTEAEKLKARSWKSQAITLVYSMAAGLCVFTGLGYWVDQKRGGGSGFTLLGMFLGLLYSGYELWKLVRSANRDETS